MLGGDEGRRSSCCEGGAPDGVGDAKPKDSVGKEARAQEEGGHQKVMRQGRRHVRSGDHEKRSSNRNRIYCVLLERFLRSERRREEHLSKAFLYMITLEEFTRVKR